MSTSTQPPGRLFAAQLGELLELTKQADSVELKMTVRLRATRSRGRTGGVEEEHLTDLGIQGVHPV